MPQNGAEEGDSGDASYGHKGTVTMLTLMVHLVLSHTHVLASILVFSLGDDKPTDNLAVAGLQNQELPAKGAIGNGSVLLNDVLPLAPIDP